MVFREWLGLGLWYPIKILIYNIYNSPNLPMTE